MEEGTEMDAMRKAFANPTQQVVTPEITEVVTPVIEEEIKKEEVQPDVVVSEIKEEAPVVQASLIEEPVKVKSFDEELSERFGGKYKNASELEAVINAPKEEFADDNIKHWNELVKKGVKLDKEFFDLQSLDVENMTDPQEVLLESMKRKDEYRGLSEKTLKLQLDKKYNLSEWLDKDEADLTDEDIANREIILRDAQNNKDWLINFKKERTFVKPVDETVVQQQIDSERVAQENWEKFVDDMTSKSTSLSTIVDETTKEAFEYKISEADSKEFGGLMKLLTVDVGVLFNQFAEKDGQGNTQINHRKVLEMLIKNKNYDTAVKAAYNDGKAAGAKKEITELKNTNFNQPEGRTVNTGAPQTEQEAFRQAAAKQGIKIY